MNSLLGHRATQDREVATSVWLRRCDHGKFTHRLNLTQARGWPLPRRPDRSRAARMQSTNWTAAMAQWTTWAAAILVGWYLHSLVSYVRMIIRPAPRPQPDQLAPPRAAPPAVPEPPGPPAPELPPAAAPTPEPPEPAPEGLRRRGATAGRRTPGVPGRLPAARFRPAYVFYTERGEVVHFRRSCPGLNAANMDRLLTRAACGQCCSSVLDADIDD